MTTTPHHVGQVAKAEIEIAGLLEEWNSTKTDERAQTIVQRMQTLGWTAPPDPNADTPPLRPEHVADPATQARHMAQIRAVLNRPRGDDA